MKAYQLFILLIIGIISSYCSLDLPPEDEVSDPNAITSVTSAQRLLASAYSSYKPYSNALTWVLRSDDLIPTQYLAREVNLQNTYNWNDRELVNHSEDIWKSLYNTIAQCNALLERLPNVTPQNSSQRRELQLVQQRATYLKALCYFDLLRIFSPAFGQPNVQPYGILFKNSFIFKPIQARLTLNESVTAIEQLLSITAINDENTYYITPDVAQLTRAELALWTGNHSKAITLAQPLLHKYQATLFSSTSVSNIWSANASPLRLFALDTKNVTTSPYLSLEYNTSLGDYAIANHTISYTHTDVRKNVYTLPNPHTPNSFLLGKYRKQALQREQMQYYTVARSAQIVFLLAEAYIKEGNKDDALILLNQLMRVRNATTLSTTATDTETLLNLLLSEKQKEFIGEPLRFFDLKRNHCSLTKRTFSGSSINISADDYRWTLPIPASEKRYNTAILQNNGWNIGEAGN